MKGNKEVIDALNFALKLELGAVNQYWLHYRRLDDWGYTKIAKKEREELIEEMHHADKLITRIIFLEGFPKMQEIAPMMIGENLKEVLECDLEGRVHRAGVLLQGARAVPAAQGLRVHGPLRGAAARTRKATSTSSRRSSTC